MARYAALQGKEKVDEDDLSEKFGEVLTDKDYPFNFLF
jgi:hypothetical protein